ncbi:hypothetical protein OE766_29570 [Pararhizobium sp. YC-54]|uniref:hypothetical protein n=1 Tax=Pararhizobium sp. YC-54 TaxID=2986920 RepID=UPI0021F7C474|nr:hypothetical protein [Pararhizobium sp. YC-54]MCW0002334.1 hypothetical protein [Pararhizobium sp. YC-54]
MASRSDQRDLRCGADRSHVRAWHDPEAIAGGCNDYRVALAVDLAHDLADHGKRLSAPALILCGAAGAMAKLYDLPATWVDRCTTMEARAAIRGGHCSPDSAPGTLRNKWLLF